MDKLTTQVARAARPGAALDDAAKTTGGRDDRAAAAASHIVQPGAAAPQRRLTGAARRESFLDAAASLVLQGGAASVTMDGVAARTGVNKRLGYKYFANREALLRALIDRELDEATRRAARQPRRAASFEDKVRTDILVWLAMTQERGPVLMKLRYGPDAPAAIGLERPVLEWTASISAAMELPQAEAEVSARLFLSALHGASEALERGVASLEDVAALCATAALAGVRAITEEFRKKGT